MLGTIVAICISEKKGTQKKPIPQCELIKDYGLKQDAHAGNWHRQVSLLSYEKIEDFNQRGACVDHGDFGENLVVAGFDFKSYPIGTIFRSGEIVLELTQIGKECHHHCAIYHQVGDCIMPREGVFAKVIQGGILKVGDEIYVESSDYHLQ